MGNYNHSLFERINNFDQRKNYEHIGNLNQLLNLSRADQNTGSVYDRKSDPQHLKDWSTDYMLCKIYCVTVLRTVLIKYKFL